MKTSLLFLFVLLQFTSFAQSKFNIDVSTGSTIIKRDFGLYYEAAIGYEISDRITISLDGSKADLKNKDLDLKYNLTKISLHINYSFSPNESSAIEPIFGVSYLDFSKGLVLDKNNGLGVDLGVKTIFDLDKRLNYGFKAVNTFSNISFGGIIQFGVFFKYNL